MMMLKSIVFTVLLSSIALATAAADVPQTGGRKLQDWGPYCTNSYFKSGPGWTPKPGVTYRPCCGTGYICATYGTYGTVSSFAKCVTPASCGGSGWTCGPISSNPFPQCQSYYAP